MFPLSDKNMKVVALLLAVVGVVVACVMNKKVLGNNVSLGVCAISVVVGLFVGMSLLNERTKPSEAFYFEDEVEANNKPVNNKPANNKPANKKPTNNKPANNKPANNKVVNDALVESPEANKVANENQPVPTDSVNVVPGANNVPPQNKVDFPESNAKKFGCLPGTTLDASELLPNADSANIFDTPANPGNISGANFLDAGFHVGVNTVGQSLRNANRQIRSEPPNPQVKVSPWLQSTIEPDTNRKPLEIGQ